MTQDSPATMEEFLQQACQKVRRFEASAAQALADNTVDEYRAIMLEKAKFLASLDRLGQDFLSTLPLERQELTADRLRRFSNSATTAISLNSVFYMSALLYPEDYVQGSPNDLELFTAELLR